MKGWTQEDIDRFRLKKRVIDAKHEREILLREDARRDRGEWKSGEQYAEEERSNRR